jgi:hypothetical protein
MHLSVPAPTMKTLQACPPSKWLSVGPENHQVGTDILSVPTGAGFPLLRA